MSQPATLLVIDDEPQIRKFLRISLASQGYKVLEAATGESLGTAALGTEGAAGVERAVGAAVEVIPRTLAANCGANVIRTLSKLRAAHAEGRASHGIDGVSGRVCDVKELGIWDPLEVKAQTLKTAVEAATLLLRIDDIVSGLKRSTRGGVPADARPQVDNGDAVDSEHMLPE